MCQRNRYSKRWKISKLKLLAHVDREYRGMVFCVFGTLFVFWQVCRPNATISSNEPSNWSNLTICAWTFSCVQPFQRVQVSMFIHELNAPELRLESTIKHSLPSLGPRWTFNNPSRCVITGNDLVRYCNEQHAASKIYEKNQNNINYQLNNNVDDGEWNRNEMKKIRTSMANIVGCIEMHASSSVVCERVAAGPSLWITA